MIKPGANDQKVFILITGDQLAELQRHSWLIADAFGLDTRIEKYQGRKPIGIHQWDLAI